VDDCDLRALAAPYVLAALDEDERERFEAHLAGCAACAREVDAVRDSLLVLARAGGEEAPPPDLRGRVLAAVAREAQPASPARAPAPAPPREPFWRRRFALALLPPVAMAAAAAVAVVLFLGRSSTPAPLKQLGPHATMALRAAGGRRTGSVYVNRTGEVVALASLPVAPAGKVYEAWVMVGGDETRAEPAGLFHGGTHYMTLARRAHPGDVVGFTLEPAGGSARPTTQPVATARI